MARQKAEDDEDAGSSDFPDAQDYALAILECLTAAEWIERYTTGGLSYRAWRTAAAHAVRVATRLMSDELGR